MKKTNLNTLLQHPDIWRGYQQSGASPPAIDTGYKALNNCLLGQGWPANALTELLFEYTGIGELTLLMPALARLSQQDRFIAWVAPPHIPFAPALAARQLDLNKCLIIKAPPVKALWAMEQCLKSGVCSAVLGWPGKLTTHAIRRLQIASEAGHAWGVLFRHRQYAQQASPAALRIQLKSAGSSLRLTLLKRRGGWAGKEITLPLKTMANGLQ